jgi:hypothetical protein
LRQRSLRPSQRDRHYARFGFGGRPFRSCDDQRFKRCLRAGNCREFLIEFRFNIFTQRCE